MRSERGSSSSRKGKTNNKPKQPQRGLGVAQLEKIRLHGQIASSCNLPNLHATYPTSIAKFNQQGLHHELYERSNTGYNDSQPFINKSWIPNINIFEGQHFAHPSVNGQHYFMDLLNVEVLSQKKIEKPRSDSTTTSSSMNSSSSDTHELDLELRLSL